MRGDTEGDSVALALYAMATRFELLMYGAPQAHLRAAGEEALDEISRLEHLLSFYMPTSELSGINAWAADGPVPVSPTLMNVLVRAREIWEVTDGAFDVTVAPLMRCWGFSQGTGRVPTEAEVEAACLLVGMNYIELDLQRGTVHFTRPGMMLDLGSIGKGYAIDQAITILRGHQVESALLHGGSDSVYGMGSPPGSDAWRIGINWPGGDIATRPLVEIALCNRSLSVSAQHGKRFNEGGRTYGHVIDPRTGWPSSTTRLAAVTVASATVSDAVSTGILVAGAELIKCLERSVPDIGGVVVVDGSQGEMDAVSFGALLTTVHPFG